MPLHIPKILEAQGPQSIQKTFLAKKFGTGHSPAAMKAPHPIPPDSGRAIAKRLRTVRWWVCKGNQTAFAEGRLKIGVKRWNNMERGGALSKDIAFKLVRLYPAIRLEWLWWGSVDHMAPATLDALETAQRELEEAETGKVSTSPAKRDRVS
jgi:hypothetical protein